MKRKLERLKARLLARRDELAANTEWRTRLPLARAVEEYGQALPLIEEFQRDVALYRKLAGLPKYAALDFILERKDNDMSYPIWRTKVFETLDRMVEERGAPLREMIEEWIYRRDPSILSIISDREVTCPICADSREVMPDGIVKACEGEGCADGDFTLFSLEGLEHARRVTAPA